MIFEIRDICSARQACEKGFTLIEMAMVMVIMGIVVSIMLTVMPSIVKTAKVKEARANLEKMNNALLGYMISTGGQLPFADTDRDGTGDTGQYFGWLPYKDLGLSSGNDVWGYPIKYGVYADVTTQSVCAVLGDGPNGAGWVADEDSAGRCSDGIDNDDDSFIDCNDTDCSGIGTCASNPDLAKLYTDTGTQTQKLYLLISGGDVTGGFEGYNANNNAQYEDADRKIEYNPANGQLIYNDLMVAGDINSIKGVIGCKIP